MSHVTILRADCQSHAKVPAGTPDVDFAESTATDFVAVQTQQALIQAVRSALRSTGHAPLRDLDVEICRGVVVLWGRVPTYYQKQLAQVTAQQVEGVRAIANGLEVVCASGCPSTREQS